MKRLNSIFTVLISLIAVAACSDVQPIGEIQGSGGVTPLNGQSVTVQAVVYQKTLRASSRGGASHGIFIQNTPETADASAETSDGLFIYMGGSESLRTADGEAYAPQVGDEIRLTGKPTEYYDLTQLEPVQVEEVVRQGLNVDEVLPKIELDPPTDIDEAAAYYERLEGMRVTLPSGLTAVSGRNRFGEATFAHPKHFAGVENPYARRIFRDPHPLDNNPDELFDDGNGHRIIVASMGVAASAGDPDAKIPPVRTFDTLRHEASGGLYYAYEKYMVEVDRQLDLEKGVDPAENSPPAPADEAAQFSLAIYNVENLYDYRNDPNDGCDFEGDSGCEGVDPPFNYVPADEAAYRTKLKNIAQQIVEDLDSPDILLIQEAEDQDIAALENGEMAVMQGDNADGQIDSLQDLALEIAEQGGATYRVASDRDAGDYRGIATAFMYRADRVELADAAEDHPIFGAAPAIDYPGEGASINADVQNPKAFDAATPGGGDSVFNFSRPTHAAQFRLWREGVGTGEAETIYLVNNHFSSGPNRRVEQRTEQANYAAAVARAALDAEPGTLLALGGDLNVYPRPDDPFRPGDAEFKSDQLAGIYEAGLFNLYDYMLEHHPAGAYSYVYAGQAQTLDSLFVSDALKARLSHAADVHINSDYPEGYDGDGNRGASDHDPLVAVFAFGGE